MKPATTLLCLVLLSLISTQAKSQKTHDINFLQLDNAKLREKYNFNEKITVKVKNINRFVYKVTSEKTEEDFNIKPPALLTSIKLPGYMQTSLPVAGSAAINKAVNTAQTAIALQTDLQTKLQDLLRAWQTINLAIDYHNTIVHKSLDCSKDYSTIESDAKNILIPFVGALPANSVADMAGLLEKLLVEKIIYVNEVYSDMEALSEGWKNEHLKNYRSLQVTFADQLYTYTQHLKATENAKPLSTLNISNSQKQLRDHQRKIEESKEDFQSENNETDEIMKKAKTVLDEINKFKEAGSHFKLADDIRKVNEANYTFYTETVAMKKDEYRFKISATSENLLSCNRPSEQKFEAILRTKGGIKFDFSTGLFVMMGSDEFLGRTYYLRPIDSTHASYEAADNGKRALLGIGALMHIYKRSPANFKIGGVVGVSSSTDFDMLNFHLGASLITGDKDRICLSIGFTGREVKLLDRKYTLGKTELKEDLPEEIPTFKMFPKIGGFISLTYNISRFN